MKKSPQRGGGNILPRKMQKCTPLLDFFWCKEFQFMVSMTREPEENYQLVNNVDLTYTPLESCLTDANYQIINASTNSLYPYANLNTPRAQAGATEPNRVRFLESTQSIPAVLKSPPNIIKSVVTLYISL